MYVSRPSTARSPQTSIRQCCACMLMLALPLLTGCLESTVTTSSPQIVAQTYLGPDTYPYGNPVLQTYAIDHSMTLPDHPTPTYVQTTYSPGNADESYIQLSGNFSMLSQDILDIGISYECPNVAPCESQNPGLTYTPPETAWAFELPGQAALVQMPRNPTPADHSVYRPFVPLASNLSCPSNTTPENFLFITIPTQLVNQPTYQGFSPMTDSAFGSFTLTAGDGGAVNFSNVAQNTLPSANGSVANPSPASASAVCSTTFYAQSTSYPPYPVVIDPGSTGTPETIAPSATIAVSPSGFLVEDNGAYTTAKGPALNATNYYQNLLGAGLGSVAIPQPAAPVTTSMILGQQYLGFLYGGGNKITMTPTTPPYPYASRSRIASFGLAGQQSACPTLPAQNGSTLYGGEFTNNDPSTYATGNCDIALNLGTQSPTINGLYPAASITVGGSYPGYDTPGSGITYTFPAVAIVGQINGKNAVFAIGLDTTGTPNQAWGIYLLQSN